jgi:catechol 2,3-dioxygenase-like lactoylglutathione lyase family enzyme
VPERSDYYPEVIVMQDFSVIQTVHMGMVVGDLKWTVPFLQDVFGFKLIDTSPRDIKKQSFITGVDGAQATISYMQSPGLLLEVVEYSNPPGRIHHRPEMVEVGHFHICLLVDDVNAVIQACKAYDKRISFLSPSPMEVDSGPNKGNKVIVMRLPDGVMLELISHPQKQVSYE